MFLLFFSYQCMILNHQLVGHLIYLYILLAKITQRNIICLANVILLKLRNSWMYNLPSKPFVCFSFLQESKNKSSEIEVLRLRKVSINKLRFKLLYSIHMHDTKVFSVIHKRLSEITLYSCMREWNFMSLFTMYNVNYSFLMQKSYFKLQCLWKVFNWQ